MENYDEYIKEIEATMEMEGLKLTEKDLNNIKKISEILKTGENEKLLESLDPEESMLMQMYKIYLLKGKSKK